MSIKLSATRISTFLQCKRRYFYAYVAKAEKVGNPAFRLGTAVHAALEFAGKLWIDKELVSFDDDQVNLILDKYVSEAVAAGVYDSSDFMSGIEMLKNKLLNFESNGKILALETKFGFDGTPTIVTSKGVELIGAIDKLVEVNEDTLLVVDYKTSRTVPDTDKLRSDIQLSMYHFVANKMFPQYNRVILALDMLRPSELVYTYRTQEELRLLDSFLNEVHTQMVSLKEDKVVGQLNPLCSWCDFRNICPECKKAVNFIDKEFPPPEAMSPEELHAEWSSLRSRLKLLETRKGELSTYLITQLDSTVDDITDGSFKFVTVQKKRETFNPKALVDLVPEEEFLDMITVSSKKVTDFANKNPKIKDKILAVSETVFSSPYVDTRKNTKDTNKTSNKKTKSKKD